VERVARLAPNRLKAELQTSPGKIATDRENGEIVTDHNNIAIRAGAPDMTSTGLLEGAKRRDPEAWRRLSYLYGPLLYCWCRRGGLQPSDAEDVVQEVFLTVANRINSFERRHPDGTFRGWLRGILRNKIGDWIRRRRAHERELDGPVAQHWLRETAVPEPDEEEDAALAGLYHRALELIRCEFEERSWQAFWRVVVEEHSPADVAADLNMTRNAVYLSKSRILSRFHEVLGDT
jgi:RNA polymerase sigma-70 factor (ECF subfamily)